MKKIFLVASYNPWMNGVPVVASYLAEELSKKDGEKVKFTEF